MPAKTPNSKIVDKLGFRGFRKFGLGNSMKQQCNEEQTQSGPRIRKTLACDSQKQRRALHLSKLRASFFSFFYGQTPLKRTPQRDP